MKSSDAVSGSGWVTGQRHILRGEGSISQRELMEDFRPDDLFINVGFRCAGEVFAP